jgi:hypothetical protein
MSLNNEDEFGTRPASEADKAAWDAENIRGLRSTFVGQRVDTRGNRFNEYVVNDDEYAVKPATTQVQHAAGCVCVACQTKAFNYMNWHQRNHKNVEEPSCAICVAQRKFRAEHPDLIGKRIGVNG